VGTAEVPCVVEHKSLGGRPNQVTWSEIYRDERDSLVRLAYLVTGSRAVAEDLVQDTFIRVMARLEPSDSPGPYLKRSVLNACYSWHRRNRREVHAADEEDHRASSEGREKEAQPVEMWDALSHLSQRQRTILVMRYYLDMTEADVAATLGCRIGTVKSTSHRALKDLRRMLER
jgi:RNA polymerase sigma-70 factor (sigma-E family)